MPDRRFLLATVAGLFGLAAFRWLRAEPAQAAEKFEIEKTDAEWRAQLTPQQYDILRQHGTERPGSSPLLKEHRKGVFACAGCDLPLFSSDTKFESGTGWPSFRPACDIASTALAWCSIRQGLRPPDQGGNYCPSRQFRPWSPDWGFSLRV